MFNQTIEPNRVNTSALNLPRSLLKKLFTKPKLNIGIEFSGDSINVLGLKTAKKTNTNDSASHFEPNKSVAVICFYQTLQNEQPALIKLIDALHEKYSDHDITITTNLELNQVISKVIAIDKRLSELEVHHFLMQKLSRIQRFAGCDVSMNFCKITTNEAPEASTESYYMVACDKVLVQTVENKLSKVRAKTKLLEVNSLGLLRLINTSRFSYQLNEKVCLICYVFQSQLMLLIVNHGLILHEKVYPLVEANHETGLYEQLIKILNQLTVRMQIAAPISLFISGNLACCAEFKTYLYESFKLSVDQLFFIRVKLPPNTSETLNYKSLNNEETDYLISLGLASKQFDGDLISTVEFVDMDDCDKEPTHSSASNHALNSIKGVWE